LKQVVGTTRVDAEAYRNDCCLTEPFENSASPCYYIDKEMRRLFQFVIFILLAGLLLSSCSDMAIFTPTVKESVGITVLSLSEGDFLNGDEAIDFIIQTDDQSAEPDLLEITLTTVSEQGVEQNVWNTSISSPLTDEELELLLPDLETGQYTIVFTVVDEEGRREEEKISFFYVTGEYAIKGISSYPPTTMAGHETVLEADLLYPEQANPYVRWSQDDIVLAKGSLEEGLQKITWMAPQEEGVYSIRVELFPVPPSRGGDFSFSSSVELTAKLFVSTASLLTEDELTPEDSYYSLFHLNGSLRNTGFLGKGTAEEEAQEIGQVRWNNVNGITGLKTGPGSGLLYPLNILPILEGELSPCTITFKLISAGENADRNLMSIGRNEGFRFRIFFDSEGQLVATIGVQDTQLRLPSGIFTLEPDQHQRIDLSLVPLQEHLQALWFLDGQQTATVSEIPLPGDLPRDGQTIIAGDNGFSGTITELGVYYRDPLNRLSVDPEIYRKAMQKKYGRRLVLAEGFEGLHLPDPESWKLIPSDAAAYLRSGRLILPVASGLTLPYFELVDEETDFLVEFFGTIPPGSTAALQWEGASTPFLVIDPTGNILAGEQPQENEEFDPTGMNIRLALYPGWVILTTADGPVRYDFQRPAGRYPWLSVTLRSPSGEGDLEIDTILIVQEQRSSS
jgi:hypothetical protein